MHDDDQPEHQLERQLAGLVAKRLLSDQCPRPATKQLNKMQASLGCTPAATQCAALVVQVEAKSQQATREIGIERPVTTLPRQTSKPERR